MRYLKDLVLCVSCVFFLCLFVFLSILIYMSRWLSDQLLRESCLFPFVFPFLLYLRQSVLEIFKFLHDANEMSMYMYKC